MRAGEVYLGSDGEVTKRFYAELEKFGPLGLVAMNLFRARKCSERAKKYRGGNAHGRFKAQAYERKQWSMGLLCEVLAQHGEALGFRWGWREDPRQHYVPWVLYVDIPQGQVSFHSPARGGGPDYTRPWDGQIDASPDRIIWFCNAVLDLAKTGAVLMGPVQTEFATSSQ
jgi:hypothetical protein